MLGYVTMAMVVAPMLAPLAGGYLDEWFGWRSTFYAVIAIGGAVLGLAWLMLHETHHDRRGGEGPLAMLRGFGVLLRDGRSEEHTSELQSLMRISYALFC